MRNMRSLRIDTIQHRTQDFRRLAPTVLRQTQYVQTHRLTVLMKTQVYIAAHPAIAALQDRQPV